MQVFTRAIVKLELLAQRLQGIKDIESQHGRCSESVQSKGSVHWLEPVELGIRRMG